MKRYTNRAKAVLFALVLTLSMVGCDKKSESTTESETGQTQTSSTEGESTEATNTDATSSEENVEIELGQKDIELEIGGEIKVTTTITPDDQDYELIWASSNNLVATVRSGVITGNDGGNCVISVKVKGTDAKAQVNVSVKPHETDGGSFVSTEAETTKPEGNTDGGSITQATTQAPATEAQSTTQTPATEAQSTTQAPATEAPATESYYCDYSNEVLALVNAERAKVGAPALTLNSSLNYAGQIRAKECAVSFSHTRPDGTSCFTVGTEAGCSIYGENIAAGYWSAEAVVTGWVNSPGHYANMVNPVFTSMGVGTYYDSSSEYGIYWTQLFN